MAKISRHFLPHFFSFAIESYIDETDLHLVSVKNITFKSSSNWFKIDIRRLLRPLTVIFNYAQTMYKMRFGSQGVILDGFQQKKMKKRQWNASPPPLTANSIKKISI